MLEILIIIVVWSIIALIVFDLKKIASWQTKVRAEWKKIIDKVNN